MFKKIVVGLLLLTIVGSTALAFLERQNTLVATTEPQTSVHGQSNGRTNGDQTVQVSANDVGDMWSSSGMITDLNSVGMTLTLNNGDEIYIELGPSEFWQSQDVNLNMGASVSVDGFFNGTDYHARTVTTAEGKILALRNEAGQPLWSGGNNNGGNGGQVEVQIPADQWVTVDGTVTALSNNGLIMQATDGQSLVISFGRADFWQTQDIMFAVNDQISILGFWQNDQFSAGQVTKIATGERILLRDPNGRPLWAGPGRTQKGGNGNGGGRQHTSSQPELAVTTTSNQ
ncbi:MAG: hypothetical protein R3E39_05825 [Anaerolineae bacterium]